MLQARFRKYKTYQSRLPFQISSLPESKASIQATQHVTVLKASKPSKDTIPQDLDDEDPPDTPFFDTEFQATMKATNALVERLTSVLKEGHLAHKSSSGLQKLSQEAEGLCHFDCPATRTIGLVGESGAGMVL